MSEIVRPGNVKAFAGAAQGTERLIFGELTQSDLLSDNLSTEFFRGWAGGVDVNGFPPMEYFNGFGFTATQLISYLFQRGVAEWHATQEYYHPCACMGTDGVLYRSTADSLNDNPVTSVTGAWDTDPTGKSAVFTYTSNDTHVPSARTKSIKIVAVGAGGGGGGAFDIVGAESAAGAGGAGGGAATKFTDTIDASYAVVVGSGGAGGAASSNSFGVTGGNTTVISSSTNIAANGGAGGRAMQGTSGSGRSESTDGGVASGGDTHFVGNQGGPGIVVTGELASYSPAGSSIFGGSYVETTAGVGPGDAVAKGCGGAGAAVSHTNPNQTGGAGAGGVVIITEYY